MAGASIFDCFGNGNGARLSFGSAILVYVIVYNETSAPCAFFATLLATLYGALAARCKSSLQSVQIPYVRASNKFDFGCLFMATWLDALAVLCACAALARTLSMCLDAMTGGLARILILGRNAPTNEPWPDVLGVAIVFLVTGMFMLGLENSRAFSFIMGLGMFGLNAILSAVSWWHGNMAEWSLNLFRPDGVHSFLIATALLSFSCPSESYQQRGGGDAGMPRYKNILLFVLVCVSLLLASSCLATIIPYKPKTEFIAVPIFDILDSSNFHKLVPAAACLLMLTCSGSFLELFPEFYGIIVRLATSEWRILSKQISYESAESGNPVLAVFIGGSLCAMLAFACPLKNLCYALAASHLSAGCFRAFYLLYSPYRPKFIIPSSSDSSLSYSRLSAVPATTTSASTATERPKRSLWHLNLNRQRGTSRPRTKPKNRQEVEKEWLLLGEPTSPIPQREQRDVESTILSDSEVPPSDFEFPERCDNTDSDSSTDIDAIVDEYRQKIKVTTAGPLDSTVRLPSASSWHVTIFAIIVISCGIALTIAGLAWEWLPAVLTGFIGVFIISLVMILIPRYTSGVVNSSPVTSCLTITLSVVLFYSCAEYSWAAILAWILAGLIMVLRCDTWCCNCLEQTIHVNEQLIPSISASAGTSTTIRVPRPSKALVSALSSRHNMNR